MNDRVYLSPPHMGDDERRLLLNAFDSNWIAPVGPHLDAFEEEVAARVGVRHAVALSSGTAALHLALRLVGVRPCDEVVTSTLTFCATANAIIYCGARPVFVDADPNTWCMDPALLRKALERHRPRAVVPVDIYGQCADYDAIRDACSELGVPIIEDAAEALGAHYRGRAAGSLGDLGVLSFNGNKIITTSGGGMLLTNCEEWAVRARYLATQARDPAPHYEHSVVGYNYRLSNLLAAVGRGQLRHLDRYMHRRRDTNEMYRRLLAHAPGIAFMPTGSGWNGWLTCITVDATRYGATRDDIRAALEEQNIEARPVWKPLHMQTAYAGCETVGGEVAEGLFDCGLCLPSGSSLRTADLYRVARVILKGSQP